MPNIRKSFIKRITNGESASNQVDKLNSPIP